MLALEDILSIPASARSPSPGFEHIKFEAESPLLTDGHYYDQSLQPRFGDAAHIDDQKLTSSLSSFRLPRLPTVLPHHTQGSSSSAFVAISSPTLNTTTYNFGQDVRHDSVNQITSHSRASSQYAPSSTPIESPLQTFLPSPSHGSLNPSSSSLRTPFHNHEQLRAFCGLPQLLPPPPRPTRKSSSPASVDPISQFHTLKSNYLKMLSQKPTDTTTDTDATMSSVSDSVLMPPPPALSAEEAMHSIGRGFPASPAMSDFMTSPGLEFLTSPMDDSPFSEYLSTPMLTGEDYFDNSPVIPSDDFNDFGPVESLFPEMEAWGEWLDPKPPVTQAKPLSTPEMDSLYTISPETTASPSFPPVPPLSPETPSMTESTRRASSSRPHSTRRSKASPTGTRKNITPDSLVPMDAPIQSRNYQTPSSTSRKDVPAVFVRKRARTQAFGDDDEELADLPPNATEKEQIEHKRRQNTLAARKSRKRKLEHQLYLEEKVEQQERDIERWKTRAETLQKMLAAHGVTIPPFED